MKTGYWTMASGLLIALGCVWGSSAGWAQGMMGAAEKGMSEGQRGMGKGMHRHNARGRHRGNHVRHRVIMMGPGLPQAYQGIKNALPVSDKNIEAGKTLFVEQCVSCHGAKGVGDGEAGRELNPKPANIAFVMDKRIASDGFLFWAISEGGISLKTAMPAFKDTLSDEQRWQIIHYLRTDLVLEQ